jgi:ATP-binding protein involved in chromosome partitioning
VAERAGAIALQTRQRLAGVIENMSWLQTPDGTRMEIFGSGGGKAVADSLSRSTGASVPLLGQVPLDPRLREQSDAGTPIVLAEPEAPASAVLRDVSTKLSVRARGLAGRMLNVTPTGHR